MVVLRLFMPFFYVAANCLTAPNITLWQQLAYRHKANSLWRIDNKKAYTTDNGYNEMAVNLRWIAPGNSISI